MSFREGFITMKFIRIASVSLLVFLLPNDTFADDLTASATGTVDATVIVTLLSDDVEAIQVTVGDPAGGDLFPQFSGNYGEIVLGEYNFLTGLTNLAYGVVGASHTDGSYTFIVNGQIDAEATGGYSTAVVELQSYDSVNGATGHWACGAAVGNWGDGDVFLPNNASGNAANCITLTPGDPVSEPAAFVQHIPPGVSGSQPTSVHVRGRGTL
jgi:hypothetical protein